MALIKQVVFRGSDDDGNIFCLPILGGLEKTAAVGDVRSKLHPRVQDFVGAVKQTSSGIYVLVNALGAGEYWGSNVNGDLFPEKALIHSPPEWEGLSVYDMRNVGSQWPYGFPTFMAAHPYKHHQNKDPSRAFGRVDLAVWNPDMHRVELVVYLDRALCMQFDGYDIIERIERGEFPDVSMGCKVPFDVCTICGNQSKTRHDYCQHASMMMNKILPDGRKVAVRNDTPKFFDISFVFIGADKTAKVMAKLAHKGRQVCLGEFCTIPRLSADVGAQFSKQAGFTPDGEPTESIENNGEYTSPKMRGEEILDQFLSGFEIRRGRKVGEPERLTKLANDPIKKSIRFDGLDIGLEWVKGETREYKDKKTGKVNFSKLMKADYGYIKRTKDNDGEELDVYIGPNRKSENVYIIKQLKDDGSFDEHKVMLGYDALEEAKESYLDHMPPRRLGAIEETDLAHFKKNHLQDAKDMAKEACSCVCGGLGDDCGGSIEKFAAALFPVSSKTASHKKTSELIKLIPAGPFTKETLPRLERAEPNIPPEVLDEMAGKGLGSAASTAGMMGVVLKPREFQRIILVRMGDRGLADELDSKNMTFGPTQAVDESIPVDQGLSDEELKELLQIMGVFRNRTIASPALQRRVSENARPAGMPAGTVGDDPVMSKISAAYNGYRRALIKKANQIEHCLNSDPQLRAELYGQSMVKAFAGGIEKQGSASVLGPDSLAYLVGAFHENRGFHITDPGIVVPLAQTGGIAEVSF